MRFSLIMVTGGRTTEVGEFMHALTRQTCQDFELIIVQQNEDERLAPIVAPFAGMFPFQVVRSLPRLINHSRNVGAAIAAGDILGFPDDDCVYPPDLLAEVDRALASGGPDVFSGVAISPEGSLGSGRWHGAAGPITRETVWTSAIEFNLFIRRALFAAIGGFDQAMGLGTPFASGDAQDLILAAMQAGGRAVYDPRVRVIHPDKRLTPVAVQRAYNYGAGMGYVLRKHHMRLGLWLTFLVRPAAGIAVSLLRRHTLDARYYWLTFRGRLAGLLAPESRAAS